MARLSREQFKEDLVNVIDEALDELAQSTAMDADSEAEHIADRVFSFLSEHDTSDLALMEDENPDA